MGKLVQRLRRAAEGVSQPMGFGVGARERLALLVLIAALDGPDRELSAGAVSNGAEFLLFSGDQGEPPQTPATEVPWGVRMPSLTEETQQQLKEAGCDFVLLPPGDTPSRLLADEDMDVILAVPTTAEDRALRALDQLPVEAVFIEGEAPAALTLQKLLDYTAVASGLGQSLLAEGSPQWGRPEVEQLRDIGLSGLLVAVRVAADLEGLRSLREAVLALPARSRRREERPRARLPQVGISWGGHEEEEEEDDEDE